MSNNMRPLIRMEGQHLPSEAAMVHLWQWHGDLFDRVSFSVPNKEAIGGFTLVNTSFSLN